MKSMIAACLMIISTVAFSEVTKTSSDNPNPDFLFSDYEVRVLGENMRSVAREDMGKLYYYSCLMSDNVEMKCTFKFELPEDYCWYGAFEGNAEYELVSTGIGASRISGDVEWTAEY